MYFEIVKTKGVKKWHARIRGDNNRIVFWTQNYYSKADAKHACEIVQSGARSANVPLKPTKLTSASPAGDS
jgi:uncharacterized protein YegP (UPF0339 family)